MSSGHAVARQRRAAPPQLEALGSTELRRRRRALRLTQAELAERLAVTANTVARWERGELGIGRPRQVARTLARLERTSRRSPGDNDGHPAPQQPQDNPPSSSHAAGSATPHHNLPAELSSFVGREAELTQVAERLRTARLVTLSGPGGVGKTRLALKVAARLVETFPDGVFFVPLAPLLDSALVPSAIAQTLGVKESSGRPLLESLQEFLRDRRVLLVLDNFEHVLAGAPIVATLLSAAPRLTALVTSRAVLRLSGEQELAVPPLALPEDLDGVSAAYVARFEAAHLFVDRGRAAKPDFALTDANAALVGAVCRRLDGLPLALELAAARLRALPLATLLDRLDRRLPLLTGGPRDLPARQQTLRNTIAWSYDLLGPDEQALFRWLSVFRGFTLEAAEALCATAAEQPRARSVALPPLGIDVLDGVSRLLEQSLLRQEHAEGGQPWYAMAETIREYATERLAESGDAPAIQRRHILYYLRLTESADPELHGPQQMQWLARLEREHNNVRAAFDVCCASGYADPAYRIGLAVWWFWLVHGHLSEAREQLTKLLLRFPLQAVGGPRAAERADLRARALYAAAHLSNAQGDYVAARRFQEEALGIRRALGDPMQVAAALQPLGTAAALQGDHEAAQQAFREALDIARTLGNDYMAAMSLHDLANVLHEQAEYSAARELADEAIALLRHVGQARALGSASLTRALIARDEGDYATAESVAEEALQLYQQAGDPRSVAMALANLGGVATVRGEHTTARQRFGASLAIFQDLADMPSTASIIERFALLAIEEGDYLRALQLASAADGLRRAAGVSLSPTTHKRLEASLAPARQALGEPAAAAAWRAGQSLSLSDAVALALSPPGPRASKDHAGPHDAGVTEHGASGSRLTAREQQVAGLIARGLTNRQIGATLVITEGTAASHVVHILDKLGLSSRAQVAVWAAQCGLSPHATQ